MLARIRAEDGFFDAVVKERRPWLARVADVRGAVLARALDSKSPSDEQAKWMQRYFEMVGVDPGWK